MPAMSFEAAVHAQAIELDKLSLQMTAAAGSGHPTTAMSLGHIVTVLMFHTMRWSPDQPDYPTSDRLVLSEGHAVPIVYAAYAHLGGVMVDSDGTRRPMTVADAMNLRAADSPIDGHPNPGEGFPFFDAATGSLGQGLSVAAGLAEAARIDNSTAASTASSATARPARARSPKPSTSSSTTASPTSCPSSTATATARPTAVSPQQSPTASRPSSRPPA